MSHKFTKNQAIDRMAEKKRQIMNGKDKSIILFDDEIIR
jgi:hypothetical protein